LANNFYLAISIKFKLLTFNFYNVESLSCYLKLYLFFMSESGFDFGLVVQ
jgi:hypothetical protein